MKKMNGRALFLWMMTLILCMTACAPAFASEGDRTLFHEKGVNGYNYQTSIRSAFRLKDGFCLVCDGEQDGIRVYAAPGSEPVTYRQKDPYAGMVILSDGRMVTEEEFKALEESGELDKLSADPLENPDGTGPEAPAGQDGSPAEAAAEAEAPAGNEFMDEAALLAALGWDADDAGEMMPEDGADATDELPVMDYTYEYVQNWFSWKDGLYGIVYENEDVEGEWRVTGARIRHAVLENGEYTLEDAGLPQLDIAAMLEESGDTQFYQLESVFVTGDTLVGRYYGMSGERVAAFDLNSGSFISLPVDTTYTFSLAAGPDGSLLIGQETWNGEVSCYEFSRMDPATLAMEKHAELTNIGVYNLCAGYDPETDALYYCDKGELWKKSIQDGEAAATVNDCPIDPSGVVPLAGGFVLIWNDNTALVRNTDPTLRSSAKMYVYSEAGYPLNTTLSETVFDMAGTRGDVSVILQSGNIYDGSAPDILPAMMSQDGSTDIYVLSFESQAFKALRSRGYLTDLGADQRIADSVNRMYPYLRDAVMADGKVIALPLQTEGRTIGIHTRTWELLGGKEEELPKTWSQFFDWLKEDVPGRLEGTETKVTEYPAREFCNCVREMLLKEYQVLMDSRGETDYVFNTPELRDLLTRLDGLDWSALKINEDDEYGSWDYENPPLLEMYAGLSATSVYDDEKLLPLGFEEDGNVILPVQLYAAFVNPYSAHQEEAREFLTLALENLNTDMTYSFFADKTEAVRSPGMETYIEEEKKRVEEIKKELETAEGENKSMLEENLQWMQENLEDMEKYSWLISAEQIEVFRKNTPYLKVMGNYFLYDMFGTSDPEEAYQGWSFYYNQDEKSPEEWLGSIDSKIQLIRKEGN